jgi:hypothetical protein
MRRIKVNFENNIFSSFDYICDIVPHIGETISIDKLYYKKFIVLDVIHKIETYNSVHSFELFVKEIKYEIKS